MRTMLFTAGPLLVGLAQLINASVHGAGVWPVAVVATLMGTFSVLVTQYHLTKFRRRNVCGSDWETNT